MTTHAATPTGALCSMTPEDSEAIGRLSPYRSPFRLTEDPSEVKCPGCKHRRALLGWLAEIDQAMATGDVAPPSPFRPRYVAP